MTDGWGAVLRRSSRLRKVVRLISRQQHRGSRLHHQRFETPEALIIAPETAINRTGSHRFRRRVPMASAPRRSSLVFWWPPHSPQPSSWCWTTRVEMTPLKWDRGGRALAIRTAPPKLHLPIYPPSSDTRIRPPIASWRPGTSTPSGFSLASPSPSGGGSASAFPITRRSRDQDLRVE